jgi:hypothetical protein
MSKHTPGPWVVTDKDNGIEFGVDTAGGEWGICTVAGGAGETLKHDSQDASAANARLIAAAPELLDALKALVGLARMGAAPLSDYKAALRVADEAIAKATGTAP